jgi:tetratricopeptide (TPR) repeat protein
MYQSTTVSSIRGGRGWTWLAVIVLLSMGSDAQSPGSLQEVCGACQGLTKRVEGLDKTNIINRADREQGSGDFVGAAKTMCGGVCNGKLLDDPGGYSNLGVLVKELGLLAAAKACYRTASRLEPTNAGHKYRTGNAMLATNDLGQARAAYVQATKLNPYFGDAYNNLGNCLAAMYGSQSRI